MRRFLWLLLSHAGVAAVVWIVAAGRLQPKHEQPRPVVPDHYGADAYLHYPGSTNQPRLRLKTTRVRFDGEFRDFGEQPPDELLHRIELAGGRVVVWGAPAD